MLKRITLMAVALLVLSLAFFGCDTREFSGTAPEYGPFEDTELKKLYNGFNKAGFDPDDNGWFSYEPGLGGQASIAYELPPGYNLYKRIIINYETKDMTDDENDDVAAEKKGSVWYTAGGTPIAPGVTVKRGTRYSLADIPGVFAGSKSYTQYPNLLAKGELVYPLSIFTSGWVSLQVNDHRSGGGDAYDTCNAHYFDIRITSIVLDFEETFEFVKFGDDEEEEEE